MPLIESLRQGIQDDHRLSGNEINDAELTTEAAPEVEAFLDKVQKDGQTIIEKDALLKLKKYDSNPRINCLLARADYLSDVRRTLLGESAAATRLESARPVEQCSASAPTEQSSPTNVPAVAPAAEGLPAAELSKAPDSGQPSALSPDPYDDLSDEEVKRTIGKGRYVVALGYVRDDGKRLRLLKVLLREQGDKMSPRKLLHVLKWMAELYRNLGKVEGELKIIEDIRNNTNLSMGWGDAGVRHSQILFAQSLRDIPSTADLGELGKMRRSQLLRLGHSYFKGQDYAKAVACYRLYIEKGGEGHRWVNRIDKTVYENTLASLRALGQSDLADRLSSQYPLN